MPRAHRENDINELGGVVSSVVLMHAQKTYINGELACVDGDKGFADGDCRNNNEHCEGNWETQGSGKVWIEGRLAVHEDDVDSCLHKRIGGSGDTYIGDG